MTKEKKRVQKAVFSTRVSPSLIKRFKALASDENKPMNALLEEAMENLIEKSLPGKDAGFLQYMKKLAEKKEDI